jgi:hypothetical protein
MNWKILELRLYVSRVRALLKSEWTNRIKCCHSSDFRGPHAVGAGCGGATATCASQPGVKLVAERGYASRPYGVRIFHTSAITFSYLPCCFWFQCHQTQARPDPAGPSHQTQTRPVIFRHVPSKATQLTGNPCAQATVATLKIGAHGRRATDSLGHPLRHTSLAMPWQWVSSYTSVKSRIFVENPNPCTIAIVLGSNMPWQWVSTYTSVKPRIFVENSNPCAITIVPGSMAIAYRTSHR